MLARLAILSGFLGSALVLSAPYPVRASEDVAAPPTEVPPTEASPRVEGDHGSTAGPAAENASSSSSTPSAGSTSSDVPMSVPNPDGEAPQAPDNTASPVDSPSNDTTDTSDDAAGPSAPAPADATAAGAESAPEGDDRAERRMVALVATGVAAASLVTGIVFGVVAQDQFNCARDVLECNAKLDNKIVGTELFDLRASVEQSALFADMGYLFAATAGLVATVNFIRGYGTAPNEEGQTAPGKSISSSLGFHPVANRLAQVMP